VAIPSIARDTQARLTQLPWIINTYALIFAALLPAAHLYQALTRAVQPQRGGEGRWLFAET
jgi:hypothetical protein